MAEASKGQKWSWDQETQLLAWLDYCRLYEIDFKSTIVRHLQDTAQKNVHFGQVHRKLKRLWENLGRADSKTSNDLYQEGTLCLVELNQEERNDIRQAIIAFGPPPVKCRLRGASSTRQSPSQTLSVVRQNSESSALSTTRTIATVEIESQNPRRVPTASHTESGDIPSSNTWGDVQPDRSDISRRIIPDSVSHDEWNNSDSPAPLLLQVNSARRYVSELQDVACDVKEENSGPTGPIDLHIQAVTAVEDMQYQIKSLEQELKETKSKLEEQQGEIFALNKCLVTERLGRDKNLDSIPTTSVNHEISMVAILQENQMRLQSELIAMQEMKKDLKKLSTYGLGPSDSEIQSNCDLIESGIADACSSLSAYNLMQEETRAFPASEGNKSALSNWTHIISGYNIEQFLLYCSETRVYEFDILRPLVVAIVCSLVFDAPFSDFLSVKSPILEYYRKHISLLYGPKVLGELDLLAYKELKSDNYFDTYIIPEKGKNLSMQLCHFIKPFLTSASRLSPDGGGPGQSRIKESHEIVQSEEEITPSELFEAPIRQALQLKFDLVLSGRRFKWVFIKPGQIFDSQLMNPKGWTFDGLAAAKRRKQMNHETEIISRSNLVVKLCLFPALYKESKRVDDSAELAAPWEQPQAGSGAEDLEGFYLVVKALVLT